MKATLEQFKLALAIKESGGDGTNYTAWGDDDNGNHPPWAMGRWQMHPCFVAQWYDFKDVAVDMSWDDICERALVAFYLAARFSNVHDDEAAAGYHYHGQIHDPDFSQDEHTKYVDEFMLILNKIMNNRWA